MFTGGNTKTSEFTVYYNLAFNGILRKIHFKESGDTEFNDTKLDSKYGPMLDGMKAGNTGKDLKDETYLSLRDFLWKGYETDKNISGHLLTPDDKTKIRSLLVKLRGIRNYHSHVWHNNDSLKFNESMELFIKEKHDSALYAQYEKYPSEVEMYKKSSQLFPLFKDGYITLEGRVFFLSFFLTTGEMSAFLQQYRGTKRNDEVKYRIKQIVYRYYTHRDGATRQKFSHEDSILNALPDGEKTDVQTARQAFKIITYLNDLPETANDIDVYKLFKEDGSTIETVQELKGFVHQAAIFPDLLFTDATRRNHTTGQDEILTDRIDVMIPGSSILVRLGKSLLTKIIIDTIRLEDKGGFVLNALKQQIHARIKLIEELEQPSSEDANINASRKKMFEEHIQHRLNGNLRLQQLMRDWFHAQGLNLKKEQGLRIKLIEKLKVEPVLISYHDFYLRSDYKFRRVDRFSEFIVKYLMDFDITPHWEWMAHKFGVVGTEAQATSGGEKAFFGKFPSDSEWRLFVNDGSVIVRLKNLPDFRFQLGHRALKNLAIAYFHKKANLGTILNGLTRDAQKIRANLYNEANHTLDSLTLLERKNLPRYLLLALNDEQTIANETVEKSKELTIKRIQSLTAKLEGWQTGYKSLKRVEKNRIIMDCYQLFDWHYSNTEAYKFLRKNEYQQVSIYHYMLERLANLKEAIKHLEARAADPENKKMAWKYRKEVQKNIRELDKTKKILNRLLSEVKERIPEPVMNILRNSTGLDDILVRSLKQAQKRLNEWQIEIIKGETDLFDKVRQKLAIRKSEPLITPEVKSKWTGKQNGHFYQHVHPDVILHYFYKDELASKQSNSTKGFSLSSIVRNNTSYTSGLVQKHYHYAPYLALLNTEIKEHKAILHKVIRINNEQLVQDALLWQVAQAYLTRVNPVVKIAIAAQLADSNTLRVTNLHGTQLDIPITTEDGQIKTTLFFHQLDDILFFESRSLLEKAATHYLRRIDDLSRHNLLTGVSKLPYIELMSELRRITHQSLEFARYILNFERKIIDKLQDSALQGNYLPFMEICKQANLQEDQILELSDLRNHAFHNRIPIAWSYAEKRHVSWLRNLLGITEKEPADNQPVALTQKQNI